MSMDMSEVNSLAVQLGDAGRRRVPVIRMVVFKSGLDIESDAKTLVPVDTGNLKSSISRTYDNDGLGVTIGPTAEYGGYVETGTEIMAAQPYLSPAFDRRIGAFQAALVQAISDV